MGTMPAYTIPDDLVDALREHYAEAVDGMTDREVGAFHLRQTCAQPLRSYRRRHDPAVLAARSARDTDNATRSSEQRASDQAVRDAEGAVDMAALSDTASIA